jgi:L-threonylcarbamoyladenylate synthase
MTIREDIRRAVDVLRDGRLVAFPTETVYGLGADARNAKGLDRLFTVKGRPKTHPLIVHLLNGSMLSDWIADIDLRARRLAEVFWPGPLTLVLRRSPGVLDEVTGGQDTVALRVPAHPVALELLREFGGGIAAPSANRFGRVSPTTADHVRADLGSDVDLVLDGGPCRVGVESTIVNLTDGALEILRPGGVTQEDLEQVLGMSVPLRGVGGVRVPGALEAHYAPEAAVEVLPEAELAARAATLRAAGVRVVVLSAADVAADRLYASLRKADGEGAEVILAPRPADEGLGRAVADRLRKAAAGR